MGNAACRALGALRAEDFPGDLTPLVEDALMLSEQMQSLRNARAAQREQIPADPIGKCDGVA